MILLHSYSDLWSICAMSSFTGIFFFIRQSDYHILKSLFSFTYPCLPPESSVTWTSQHSKGRSCFNWLCRSVDSTANMVLFSRSIASFVKFSDCHSLLTVPPTISNFLQEIWQPAKSSLLVAIYVFATDTWSNENKVYLLLWPRAVNNPWH